MRPVQRQSYFLAASLMMIVVLIIAGCGGAAAGPAPTPTAAPPVELLISGSGGTATILKPLAEVFQQEHPNWSFEFLSGAGTSGGVKGVIEGTLDLGTMARPPKDEETAQGIEYVHFGTERIAFATSRDVSISALTGQQLKDIFAGKISNWSEVGGPDAAINVLARDEDETNTQVLRKALFGETPFSAGAVVLTSEGDLQKALADSSHAIAYATYGGIKLEKVPVNVLVVDDQDPADFDSAYPYARPAGLAYLPANAAKVQPFLDFISSDEARKLLTEAGVTVPAR